MDIGRVVQSSRAMTTWRPVSAIPKVDRFKFDTLLGSDFPRGSFQTWMSRPVSGRGNFSIRLQSFQLSRNARPGGNHKMSRLLIAPVVNAVRPGSEETPATELKSQLEALQLEASQVRDRYNSSRARFMRLAQVAEHLQQRALLSVKLGNEGTARQLLTEKKKVMRAAELSKQRSQLYEELSSKLSEAISRKETQLIVALSSSSPAVAVDEEPTVRVIFPTGNGSALVEEVSKEDSEEQSFDPDINQSAPHPCVPEDGDENSTTFTDSRKETDNDGDANRDILPSTHAEAGFGPEPSSDSKLVKSSKDELELKEICIPTSTESENIRRESLDEKPRVQEDQYSPYLLREQIEIAAFSKDCEESPFNLHKDESESSNDEAFLQDQFPEEPCSTDGDESAPVAMDTKVELLHVREDEAEAKKGMDEDQEGCIVDKEEQEPAKVGEPSVLKEYLLDISSQVAQVESKLQGFLLTADILLGSESETKDERVVLVEQLLEQVQSLRARIVEAVDTSSQEQLQ
ncbi:hypothetical protein MPTK1_5g08790 [Marchantia polymorpha subsp. ruderalis]|uniref:Uncharacterized protein n=5 Tax=Marchantia polymorpha TaxID=3197 RepID=A0AAF6BGD8_MARPO|nr:hypothetical protein MARPO_0086s0079 [Marchantia polymorpha]BBN11072.1 hypothetical protein Mp_5g08790 [Marchantia polymorpha subsp. ruderalis]|eukprot:PTQ33765.1 hypothetical protein MARPO_0086s0079 [Marchantia polymorpha]